MTGRPAWRAPFVRSDPPELLTHRGWTDLRTGQPIPPKEAWRQAVLDRAIGASITDDTLCLTTADTVEIWPLAGDQARETMTIEPGTDPCRPMPSELTLDTPAGPVSGAEDGRVRATGGATLTPRRASPVRVLDGAPRGTVLVGRADGTVDLWEPAHGQLLASFQLHGPVQAIVADGDRRHVVTELGGRLSLDLSALTTPYCDLLDAAVARTPWTWRGGSLVRAAPEGPGAARCAPTP